MLFRGVIKQNQKMKTKHFRLLLPLVMMPLLTFSQTNQPNTMTTIKPFQINISQDVIDDVKSRTQKTNWPNTIEGQNYGGPGLNDMKELATKFQKFDWRKAEAKLNSLPNFVTE